LPQQSWKTETCTKKYHVAICFFVAGF